MLAPGAKELHGGYGNECDKEDRVCLPLRRCFEELIEPVMMAEEERREPGPGGNGMALMVVEAARPASQMATVYCGSV